MSKTARLLEILTILGARRYPVTAKVIADKLGVSIRTIYRDIETLKASGAGISGEAGLGYVLDSDAHIPPLNFTENEIYAVLTGLEMVAAFTDDDLTESSEAAREKIMAVIGHLRQQKAENSPYRAPRVFEDKMMREQHKLLRKAVVNKQKIKMSYISVDHKKSERIVWPLGLIAWFGKWTLTAWDEAKGDYRNFRIDLIEHLEPCHAHFETTDTCSLKHFLANAKAPNG